MGSADYRLIELIRQNKHLYDQNDPDFRNLDKKEITWRAIAAAQGSTPEICRRRFRSLRDRFAKEKRFRKKDLLDGNASNPIWLRMMFLWDHLRPRRRFNWNRPDQHKRFQDSQKETASIQNVYTIVPVDSSGAPIPNHPVTSTSYILVNATAENSPAVVGLHSAEAGVQELSNVAEHVSSEVLVQESSEAVAGISSDAEQVSAESVEEAPPDVVAQESSKVIAEAPSNNLEAEKQKSIKLKSTNIATKVLKTKRKYTKRGLQSTGQKQLKTFFITKKPLKETKIAEVFPAKIPGSSQNQTNTMTDSTCNAAFCTVVKSYLDKISNPMRLSSTRIKILSMVHDEMYSTN